MNDIDFSNKTFLIAFFIGLAIGLAITAFISIFFLLTIQNALKQCAVQNQKMRPGQVWLGLIPLFSYYWIFRIVIDVSESLQAEYNMRNLPRNEEQPGYQIGMAYAGLTVASLLRIVIPIIGQLAGLGAFICWIIYWVRISKYKKELEAHQYQFQFGANNPNPYPFPNQFPGQPPQQNQNYPPHQP